MSHAGTALLCATLALTAPCNVSLPAQERPITPFERQTLEYDAEFAARVLLRDGSIVELAAFHLTTGKYRHKLLTGNQEPGMLLALSNMERITRSALSGWVHVRLPGGAELHTPLRNPAAQRFAGTLPDGSAWVATLEQISEIEVRLVRAQPQP